MTTIREHIGDGLELLIEGMPAAVATPANQAQAALMLARHSIPLGADLTAGVLGGIRYASLRIGTEMYKLKYSLIVLRPMVALEVYSEAIAWIEFKQERGMVDKELATDTISYLRRSYQKELR